MGKYAILVKSGTYDNMNTAALLASGAIANGNEVLMFFMHDAVWALKKDVYDINRKIHSPFPEVAQKIEKVDKEGKLQSWDKLLPDLKELADEEELKYVACGLMMDIFELKKEDLVDFIDDIAGVAFFTNEALEADRVLVIG